DFEHVKFCETLQERFFILQSLSVVIRIMRNGRQAVLNCCSGGGAADCSGFFLCEFSERRLDK
ncbi:hypothetical protein, partial [Victivallis vadensis]|uniref:hypothetical protein n=1 Tax=Victivallis vadensis TaxID=172901 RepID=UPI003AF69441